MIIDDLLITVGAGVIELLLYLVYPLWFLISPSYRAKVRSRWAQQSPWVVAFQIAFAVLMYVVYAGVVFVAAAVLVALR